MELLRTRVINAVEAGKKLRKVLNRLGNEHLKHKDTMRDVPSLAKGGIVKGKGLSLKGAHSDGHWAYTGINKKD